MPETQPDYTAQNAADDVLEVLATMTTTQRVEFFDELRGQFCTHCGADRAEYRCYCRCDD